MWEGTELPVGGELSLHLLGSYFFVFIEYSSSLSVLKSLAVRSLNLKGNIVSTSEDYHCKVRVWDENNSNLHYGSLCVLVHVKYMCL